MRRLAMARAVLFAVTLGSASVASASVSSYLGKPVASIQFKVEGRPTIDPKLLEVVETQVGRPLSMIEVRQSLVHLFSLERFEDIRVYASLAGGAVTLRYELVPIRRVTKIEFAGVRDAPGVDVGRLRQAVLDRYGTSPPFARVDEMVRVVTEALSERGYLHSRVAPGAGLPQAPERGALVLTVEPGPRTLTGSIDITGASPAVREDLLRRLKMTPGQPYQGGALGARLDQYVARLKAQGFYEAKIDLVVRLDDDDRVANLTLNVRAGPHVRVVVAGDPLPAATRDALAPIAREGSTDEDLLEDSSNRIEQYLNTQGYRNAAAPHVREESDGQLVITFTVRNGPQYRVSRVEVSGNPSIPSSDFGSNLRLRDGQPFSQARLDADVSAIEDLYRRRGFPSAKVRTAILPEPAATGAAQVSVLVRVVISEGTRALVGDVRFDGNREISDTTLREGLRLVPGQPFVAAQLPADREAIELAYLNHGYQNPAVDARPQFSQDARRVDIAYSVREGPRTLVDHVIIVGNRRTRTATIQRELQFKAGDPLSVSAVTESQRRLISLGLFRRVRISELRHGDETSRDLVVNVQESPATTIGYGGGGEVRLRVVRRAQDGGIAAQRPEFAPRASFEISRRNLFGKNRSVSLFTSVGLHPKDSPYFVGQSVPSSDSAPVGYGFAEYRVLGTYREPRVFDTTADAFVTGVLEQQIRSSFNFARRSVTAETVRHITRNVTLDGSYQIQSTRVFDENLDQKNRLLIDRIFPQVLLSSFLSSAIRDTRNDPIDPSAGHYLSANGQLAARAIGSEVGFVKSFMTAQAFRIVPGTRGVVLAADARLGLARGFSRTVSVAALETPPPVDVTGPVTETEIEELPASERFYAGGDNTVRGFALDTLGTPATIDTYGFPIGGSGLVIFNAELRVPVRGGLGLVGFLDAGNVFARAGDINLGKLRGAVGFGLRYKSPVGPLRIDFGFKLSRHELTPGRREGLTAFHISFGQAF